ncbi:MAG: tetratricopeptide repeat protein [Gammaproteobacteria bacterium]|nr:tetratricopeptide repeat protein [Gammaproteobacteria bacterium]
MVEYRCGVKGSLLLGAVLALFSTLSAAVSLHQETLSEAYYKSYTYEKSGNIKDAILAMKFVYEQHEGSYGINSRLAHLYTLDGKYRNAIAHYQSAISALPEALTPKLGLLYVYILSANYSEASKIGYQVISIDHYNYYGNLRLAHVLRKSEKSDLAETLLLKILTFYPADTLYLTELGLLRFDQKRYREARAVMEEVLLIDPENVEAKKSLLLLNDLQ